MKHWPIAFITIFAHLLFVQTTFAESSSNPAYSFGVLRESKYVSQGRDNLGDGGIYSFEAALEWRRLAAGAWFASADSTSYEELNLYVDYGVELGPLYSYVGYTRLEFLQEDESDNEISAGVEISDAGYFIPALDYTYSTGADGGFVELSISTEIELSDGRLLLRPYLMEGFDFGYISRAHDGPNNFQLGIDFTCKLTAALSMVGSVAHSWAHEDVRNDGRGDVSWLIIGVTGKI